MSFDNRIYLFEYEYLTYLRRMPVRYIKKKHSEACSICGKQGTEDNRLEHSHKIPFKRGIERFALTPDWLDSHSNIVSAHKVSCNKAAELSEEIINILKSLPEPTPDWLSKYVN